MKDDIILTAIIVGGTLVCFYTGRVIAKATCLDRLTKKKSKKVWYSMF